MTADLPDKLYFRIGEVADIVGVESHVLRYWESEFRIRPNRSNAGQRLFRRSDVQKFLKVKQLLHEKGFTIPGARRAMEEAPAELQAPAQPGVDAEKLRDALRRVRDLRAAISALAADLSS